MLKNKLMLIATVILFSISSQSMAQYQNQPPQSEEEARMRTAQMLKASIDATFKELDTDRDGFISKEENLSSEERKFNMTDKNQDSQISRDELLQAILAQMQMMSQQANQNQQ